MAFLGVTGGVGFSRIVSEGSAEAASGWSVFLQTIRGAVSVLDSWKTSSSDCKSARLFGVSRSRPDCLRDSGIFFRLDGRAVTLSDGEAMRDGVRFLCFLARPCFLGFDGDASVSSSLGVRKRGGGFGEFSFDSTT